MSPDFTERLSAETARMKAITELSSPQEQDAQWKKYGEHFSELPESMRPVVYYEYCKLLPQRSASGLHELSVSHYAPISFCGWADYGRAFPGVGFRINRDCFAGRGAELYYMDDDMLSGAYVWKEPFLEEMLGNIISSSSGLTNVHMHQEDAKGEFTFCGRRRDASCITSLRFHLDASSIKETLSFNREKISSAKFGGYVFVLPRTGEFFCELGEIVDGERIPLLFDDYCMK